MRRFLIISGFLGTALAAPTIVSAQVPPGCVRQDNRPAGTIIGGVAGALAGSAIAGRGDRTAGAVIGGIGGAIVGNQLAGTKTRCPEGYYETQAAPPPAYDNRGAAYDNRGSAYDNRGGAYDNRAAAYDAAPFDRSNYWREAPQGIRERQAWLERRINRGIDNGQIDRREARRVLADLRRVNEEERRMRRRNGGRLGPQDRDYLQGRLDNVAQEIRWARQNDREYRR